MILTSNESNGFTGFRINVLKQRFLILFLASPALHTLCISLSLSLSHTHTHALSRSHTHTHSLSLSLSLTHTHTHTLSLSLSLTHTHTHTLSHSDRQISSNCSNYTLIFTQLCKALYMDARAVAVLYSYF